MIREAASLTAEIAADLKRLSADITHLLRGNAG